MNKILQSFILILILSCSQKKETKIIDYGEFQIEVPKNWKKLKLKGIDSKIGGLVTSNHDTLMFDLGRFSNELDVYAEIRDSIFLSFLAKEKTPELIEKHIIQLYDSIKLDSFSKYNVEFKLIDNKKAKIISPNTNYNGTTGIYIEYADKNDLSISFNFYGIIKNKFIQQQFVKSLHTLKFKDK